MNNDNRTQILDLWPLYSTYSEHDIENMRRLIGLQEEKNQHLEAEIADMTAQRDAWFKMASTYALEQAPELETVELTTKNKCEICGDVTDNPICVKCATGLHYAQNPATLQYFCICCETTFTSGFWWSDLSEDVIVCEKCHGLSINESEGETDAT